MRRGTLTSPRRTFVATVAGLATIAILKSAKSAQFEFKCGSSLAVDHPSSVRLTQMWAAVERESDGRIHTQFLANSLLGGDPAMLAQLRIGALAFYFAGSPLASIVPLTDIAYIGFVYKDSDEAVRVMNGPLGEYLHKEIVAQGMYPVTRVWNIGMRQITASARPIHTPDDLRGFKIRVPPSSRITVDMFKDLGASPTPTTFNEMYTAVQTKLVDGTSNPLDLIETAKVFEIQKYVSMTNHQWSGQWIVANGEVWKSLPAKLQEIIERNNAKYAILDQRDVKASTASLLDKLSRQGMIINQVDQTPFRARLGAYYQYWTTAFGSNAWGLLENSLGRKIA